MLLIGLTGGIGSGKSLVAQLFAERGVPVIDTDEIAREVVAPDQPLLMQLTEVFGNAILAADGTLNRRYLRERIFADAKLRKALEGYLHPAIRSRLGERLAQIDAPYCVVAIPLLVEAGWQDEVDRVLVVDCTLQQQRERTMARDHISATQADAIIAAQAPREMRLAAADDILDNNASPAELAAAVQALHQHYLALAAA